MKNQIIKPLLPKLVILIAISISTPGLLAQGLNINNQERPNFYLSSAYVNSFNYNHVTFDPYYSNSYGGHSNKTVRVDFGIQINRRLSLDVGYIRMPLETKHKLVIDNQQISTSSRSYSRISFYSIKLNHGMSLWKNRIKLFWV